MIPLDLPVVIDNQQYAQHENVPIKEGDLVLDTKDFTYGWCDFVLGDRIAIAHSGIAELAIPMSRVRKLVKIED